MSTVLESLPQGGRVAVVRLRSMGDCILTTPALAILKRTRPDVSLAIVVEERFAAIFEGNPDVAIKLPPDWSALRSWSPRLCINLHGGPASATITALSGAAIRAGFAHFRHSFIYNVKIPRSQEILGTETKVHTAEHLASAMFYLGAPRVEIPKARLFAAPSRESHPYAVIHPVASAPDKTWPAERFMDIANHLERYLELDPIFIGAVGEDLSSFCRWPTILGAPLCELKSLIAGASLFLGNDSGPAHLAAAFGIPAVVIFGASDPVIWAPWRTNAEVMVGSQGIGSVSVRQVTEALERLRVKA
ncbi:MAG: glycosyl transferase [Acidobacteria bacterium]|nr:MAG: glycosyl transferase [Acidobacteriota bacterium]